MVGVFLKQIRKALTFLSFLFLLNGTATAQLFSYSVIPRPLGVTYQVLQTEHFKIIFEKGYLKEARATVLVLNAHLENAQSLLAHHHKFRMPVVLNGFNDQSNGYVTPRPFKQEIEITNLKGRALSPGHQSWMDTVVPHELVHAVQADLRKGFGIGGLLRPLSPDLARTINLVIPQGISEGVAVYHESRHKPGAGRLNHSFFTMRFRAAMMAEKPWSMAQLVEMPAYTRPLDRFYLGGAHLVEYLAQKDSLEFFHRSTALNYRVPFLGYGIGLWYGARKWPAKIYRAFKTEMIAREEAFQGSLGEVTQPEVLSSRKGHLQRRPRWVSNEELVVYARGYGLRGGFYLFNTKTGNRRLLRNTQSTEDFVYSLSEDRKKLYYAHYRVDPFISIKRVADLYEIDLLSGNQQRITTDKRVLAPSRAADGGLWALQNDGQGNQLVHVDTSGKVRPSKAYDHVRFQETAISPDEHWLAAVINVKGHQGIFRLDMEDEGAVEPVIVFAQGAVFDVSWSPDGRRLFFTADPDGVSNIYVYEVARNETCKVTNAQYGALEPSLSPDGKTLAYINYQHEKFDLALLPFDEGMCRLVNFDLIDKRRVTAWIQEVEAPVMPVDTLDFEVTPYRALPLLAPRTILPIFRFAEDRIYGEKKIGFGLGVSLQGTDPLQRLSYTVNGYGQAGNAWGQAILRADGHAVQPYVSAYNTLSTVITGFVNESGAVVDQVKVGRQRRGVAAGIRFPVVFDSNIFLSGMVLGVEGVMENERFYVSEEEPFQRQHSIEPAATFIYRLQSNPRDLIPNHGFTLALNATLDLKSEAGKNQALLARLTGYLPFFRIANIGLKIHGALLTQNNGGIYNLDNFLPRGYKDDTFLGSGNHVVAGFEYVQPIWYVDNGLFIIPFYIKALYAFGFTEGILKSATSFDGKHVISTGAGLGVQFRILYLFNFDLRFTASYRHSDGRWDYAVR